MSFLAAASWLTPWTLLCSENLSSLQDVHLAGSLASALQLLSTPPLSERVESVFVIGGSAVYQEAMSLPQCQRLHVTHVDQPVECDTFFPAIDQQ